MRPSLSFYPARRPGYRHRLHCTATCRDCRGPEKRAGDHARVPVARRAAIAWPGTAGASDGWRWVFLVNLLVGAVAIPMAAWRLPTAATHTRRSFDPVGLGLLTGGLLLLLIPLVQGRQDGWPAWTWICFGCCVIAFAALAAWERRADRRGGDPLLKPALASADMTPAVTASGVISGRRPTGVFLGEDGGTYPW